MYTCCAKMNNAPQEGAMFIPRNIDRIVDAEIRASNNGRMPVNQKQFERSAAHFGCSVQYHLPPFAPESSLLLDGVIHVPAIRPGKPLHRCYIHELAEACARWEGRAPILAPEPESPTKHEIAGA